MENTGRTRSHLGAPHFRFPSSWVITMLSLPSLPAAEMVNTVPTGRVCVIVALPVKKSQKSPSYLAPTPMALAVSMTEPPPSANKKSTCSLRTMSMPS